MRTRLDLSGLLSGVLAASAGVLLAGCGNNHATSSVTGHNGAPDPGASSDGSAADPPAPEVNLSGGAASSPGGQAQGGGNAHLVSAGGITIGSAFQPPAAPGNMQSPSGAMALSSQTLGADVQASGSVSVAGMVSSSGSDGIRQIVAGGDIFVDGTLRTADLGATRQGLVLQAPNGSVYVSGSIDTSGSGSGQAGGSLTITAQQVIVLGTLTTAGGGGPSGGSAGAISITTTGGAYFSGQVVAAGGSGSGSGTVSGGNGANLTIQAGGDIVMGGVVTIQGGGAKGSGSGACQAGNAGSATLDASGTVAFTGPFDVSGGAASSGGSGQSNGGMAGALKVGETKRPMSIGLTVPLVLKGGDGQAVGGNGGTALLEAHGGDLQIGGTVDASGGGSSTQPGAGGSIEGHPGPEGAMANCDVAGQVVANGGSIASGGSGNGALAGTIKLVQLAKTGNMTVETSGQVQADGGNSGGQGTAGAGGLVYVFTIDGSASIHGHLLSRGGTAPDPGGVGGTGGFVYVFTGDGHDFQSGNLTIEADGVVDPSGGDGTTGGGARNDGHAFSVGSFPAVQNNEYDVENLAVLFNSDGVHGADRGWINNLGMVIARGGKSNGSGGDIAYHGMQPDGNTTPLPGNMDLSADGSGTKGDFLGE
jgi:hypothetical protein